MVIYKFQTFNYSETFRSHSSCGIYEEFTKFMKGGIHK